MEEETSIKKRGGFADDCDLVASMFSWSLEDICNENLFEVKVIPKLFESVDHYFRSYVCPLLEETRARLHSSIEIIYRAPTAEVLALTPCRHDETLLYDVEIDYWRNRYNDRGKEPYKTLPGDVVILADAKPEDVSDLQREGRTWTLALVTQIPEDPEDETEDPSRDPEDETDDAGTDPEDETEDASTSTTSFKIKPSKDIEINAEMQKSLVVIFLTNITTNRRIWNRLHKFRNLDVIKEVADSMVQENCSLCSMHSGGAWHESVVRNLSSTLNESQTKAILTCLRKIQCNHSCAVELIWGPPGTGKTKTVSMLLFTLLRMKRRILICAPTNVAIKEVASRVRKLVIESSEIGSGTDALFCSLSDILLFGNKDRLKVNSEIEDISLDYRVKRLRKCFAALTAKRSCFTSTIDFLKIAFVTQLKECESTIPLQLPGIRHAILIGDECQLPATVESNLSDEAGFGRSLFERLSSLGHPKHLLNMQYRMHPSISTFPNKNFYSNLIIDAPNVRSKSYEKHYLPGSMFGPYSFINVTGGREEVDDVGHSRRNMVEVAIVLKLVHCLYKEWSGSKQNINIGVISPYAAQVVAIQEKLGHKYKKVNGFSVKVQSIDGFQGGEEDVVIISTVRSNSDGFIGFMSNRQRINVSLTRARHCLWILGNERTLARSGSVWEELVSDAKQRQCFFNADENKELAKAILEVKKEFDQLDDLLNGNSPLFKCARWKVLFSENFRKSFSKLTSVRTKKFVLNLLLRLSSGWRPKKKNVDSVCEKSSQILKQFKVEGLYVLCSIDIVKEEVKYIQVLKVWDVLPLEDIPRFVKRLDGIFERQTDDFISRCNEKSLKGNLEAPKNWSTSFEIVRYKNLSNSESRSDSNFGASDATCYVENCKVSESLLLMKFYSLSSGIVKHLLSDHDGREIELPFEVTVEERDMIAFQRSMFILGRSGTGKTTVLTMKLFQKEQQSRMATEGIGEGIGNTSKDACCRNNVENDVKKVEDSVGEAKKIALRQLFVTVNPKLCYAIKHHISHLKSFASGGKYLVESSSVGIEDIDEIAQFEDAPYSFVDIPSSSYPLIISFYKFLMMLDGTIGNSYFERFPDVRQILHAEKRNLKSISIQTFITTREVNYDKFCSIYWPHFNTHITKMLDSSIAFTEIMSHIKCGLQSGEFSDGRLARKDYVTLSEVRLSTLSREKREMIYDIYEDYEKMKIAYGDFDMADFVIDLHLRLKNVKYEGDIMDFVYIDEVQDLTMRQIALFKINSEGYDGRKEKGRISKIFHLSQNFRTHAGILKLAQSVIDLLYRFFPSFVDILSPETSLIFGEAPIWLEARNDENAIVNIFGKNGNGQTNFVGFGAEQVILVRDDSARKEVYNYVGKQALVLTIMECKGLEFQDVLLYNFFGSSPLKNKWRVIYEYMKEQNLLDESFPTFNPAKHIVLCSELKQLYVAITRTRQRLWICENIEELSKPMFDYWKNKDLVQVRKLDDSFALAMQVASSPEEWTSRGYKLLNEGNYEMATMCFERAGDIYGEKVAKAAGLKATATECIAQILKRLLSPVGRLLKFMNQLAKLSMLQNAFIC
ncbi:hypothetical protein GH714_016782 [Hevea brasiliensis]|uniref:UvrD-like helicase ATP-binding domain-containing protein n=1 Tax=Hevea brasiliensis TaxID=3981 RepID=A0A6A6LCZ7_HEVBR|nr:hypothetical protein GH714_016782 [Hevea brasiliensis]